MRWWLNTDHGRFSVDNAVVNGLDFSSLDPNIWMVQWTEGRGEIERQDVVADTNLNGLRETFIDVTPYAPFFQQFLALCPLLTLDQAKKVDIDLIQQIFESKRQAPFHYPVAAGDFWWDARDEAMGLTLAPSIQTLTATVDQLSAKVNNLANTLNLRLATIDAGIATQGNNLVGQINSNIVGPLANALSYINTIFSEVNGRIVDQVSAALTYFNDVILGSRATAPTNTLNQKIRSDGYLGLDANIDYIPYFPSAVDTNPYAHSAVAVTFSPIAAIPWTDQGAVPIAPVSWIPIGGTAPVSLTQAEITGIMNGIAARTNALKIVKSTKTNEVLAITTVPAVIAYDVTTGW